MVELYYRCRYLGVEFFKQVWRHWQWLCCLLVLLILQLAANVLIGELKSMGELDWIDIFGQGAIALLVLVWIFVVFSVRPGGKVTNLLVAGFSGIFIQFLQDFLDEIIRLPENIIWDSLIESVPVGFLLLTYGIWLWSKEQKVINHYFNRRERRFRGHEPLDGMTALAKLPYLKSQLYGLENASEKAPRLALLLLDVEGLTEVFHKHGSEAADWVQADLTELLRLGIRPCDLICHGAGSRFYILLENADILLAEEMATHIAQLMEHFQFYAGVDYRPLKLSVTLGLAHSQDKLLTASVGSKAWVDQFIALADTSLKQLKNTTESSIDRA